ncbi:hypothetical protein BO70DRAFT_2169 [Aspergillus heteromorphus CBS 117.55]|uniref:Uncharacterized protein n=1 Tax=Aspergillus heteromorphus CBS 117.55 TaxID=1448321 RepID=A0A317X553_9EURO|nr:uncharacterized protein BO70DRAFT_2169 [Aspergillus heteromorphus CBS 117.55]PWY92078.1 hypothetical protein BO70DRAFT_2169 [Aspergillus heteromorphus CBS 117.55]
MCTMSRVPCTIPPLGFFCFGLAVSDWIWTSQLPTDFFFTVLVHNLERGNATSSLVYASHLPPCFGAREKFAPFSPVWKAVVWPRS